jgi:hypothetical protein
VGTAAALGGDGVEVGLAVGLEVGALAEELREGPLVFSFVPR